MAIEVFFDIETFIQNDGEEEKIIPYAIGAFWIDNYKNQYYREFIGLNSAEDFSWWIINNFAREKEARETVYFYAFNIQYDLGVLRYFFSEYLAHIVKDFCMKEDDKGCFLGASLLYSTKDKYLKIIFNDLYNFYRAGGSYASRLDNIFEKYKREYPNTNEYLVTAYFEGRSITIDVSHKGSIDYEKTDLFEASKNYEGTEIKQMYYTDRHGDLRLLNLEEEQKYLRIDVFGLHLVHKENNDIKNGFLRLVDDFHGEDWKLFNHISKRKFNFKRTVAGISKLMCSAVTEKDFDETYREPIGNIGDDFAFERHQIQENSLIGGLTMGTTDLVEINDKNIHSYDVNSLYPYIMSLGMPTGLVSEKFDKKIKLLKEFKYEDETGILKGDYVVWYLIEGTTDNKKPYCDWKENIIWKGQEIRCPKFDNTFLGKYFFQRFPSSDLTRFRFLITKNYYELMNIVCNHNLKRTISYIQYFDKSIKIYLDLLLRKKEEAVDSQLSNLSPEYLVPKIAMNSLYGKAMEGSHPISYIYGFSNEEDKMNEYTGFARVTNENRICSLKCISNQDEFIYTRTAGVFVSSTGRMMLIYSIMNEIANGNEFLYADTDSIKLIVNNEVKLPINNKELGKWKFEGKSTHWLYPGKHKKYLMYNNEPFQVVHFACSGFPKKVVEEALYNSEMCKYIFNSKCNVIFKDMKVTRYINSWIQPVLNKTSIMSNNSVEPTHIIWEDADSKLRYSKCNELILKNMKINLKRIKGKNEKWAIK